jgi:hypothetical protein
MFLVETYEYKGIFGTELYRGIFGGGKTSLKNRNSAQRTHRAIKFHMSNYLFIPFPMVHHSNSAPYM